MRAHVHVVYILLPIFSNTSRTTELNTRSPIHTFLGHSYEPSALVTEKNKRKEAENNAKAGSYTKQKEIIEQIKFSA